MRILIASPYLPWPLNTGGNAGVFSCLKSLENDHEFTLVCPVYDKAGLANAKELGSQLPRVKVRAVSCGAPPASLWKRAARRGIREGRELLKMGGSGSDARNRGPEKVYYPFAPLPEPFIVALQEEISKGIDVLQGEFAEMLPLGGWFPTKAPKLFIHHQLHFVYAKRTLDTSGRDAYSSYLESMWQAQEIAYLQKYQGVVTMSEEDRKTLLPYLEAEKVFTSPSPLPADVRIVEEATGQFDGRFLFVAAEEHGPNRDALAWLQSSIWPEIFRQLPESRLVVVGKWSEAAQLRLASPGLSFSGFVPDLPATLRGGIMLVPLRIGSGIRMKIMVSMALGVPVVSTSIGSEGLLAKDGEELLVRDDPAAFALAAAQLARDAELRRRVTAAGLKAVSEHHSPEGLRRRRNQIYAALAAQHRN